MNVEDVSEMNVEIELKANGAENEALLRIRKLSRIAQWCTRFGLLFVAIAILSFIDDFFLTVSGLDEMFSQAALPKGFFAGLPFATRGLLFLIVCAVILPGAAGFFTANKLFSSFARGDVFTSKSAGRISFIGWSVTILPLVSALSTLLINAVLAVAYTAGKVKMSLEIDDGDVMAIVFGLLIVILGRVMLEASKLSEENRQFI